MDYIEALQNRYSVKKFEKRKKVPEDILKRILQAGKLSVSSLGLQPYRIHVIESDTILDELVASFYNPSQISTCSHMMVIAAKKGIDDEYVDRYFKHIADVREMEVQSLEPFRKSINNYRERQSAEEITSWNEKQGYIMLGNLIFAAALEKVDTCPIEGFKPGHIEEVLKIDSSQEVVTVTLALGYRAADDPFGQNKKVRKPDELLYQFH